MSAIVASIGTMLEGAASKERPFQEAAHALPAGFQTSIRCDNGPEMISKALRKWVAKTGPQI